MARTRPPYPPAFRAEAAALARTSGKGIPQLAHELGRLEQALRGWMKRAGTCYDNALAESCFATL